MKAGCGFRLLEGLTLPGTLRPKTQVGRIEYASIHSPIYKEPDEDGAARGLGTTLAEAVRTPRC